MLTGRQLRVLAEIAREHGDGALELTSRANIQLRALRADPADLAGRLAGAGLLPSLAHETVRNIAAPPLADSETRGLVEALDRALCADDALAGLPGRFLFAVGSTSLSADVAAIPAQNTAQPDDAGPAGARATHTAGGSSAAREAFAASAPGTADSGPSPREWAIVLGGVDVGIRVPGNRVVATMLAAAHGFLAERAGREPRPWRLREIPGGPGLIAARLAGPRPEARLIEPLADRSDPRSEGERGAVAGPLVGRLEPAGAGRFAVGVLVPLGRLAGAHLKVLARAERLAVAPWGGVVVLDLTAGAADRWMVALREAGLVTEGDSKWVGVTTCAGRPGCAKALADVRRDAAEAARFVDGRPVHWVGCERGCGSPAAPHVRVEATANGYLVDGAPVASAGLAEAVAVRRA
jgi:precorrin-3B synthase